MMSEKKIDAALDLGEPEGLWDKFIFRKGGGMLFYLDEMKVAFNKVDADGDGYISAAELGALMDAVKSPRSEEEVAAMMKRIEAEQTIKRRDADGGALIYVEQWAKVMNDMSKEVYSGKKKSDGGGFKFPWDK